MRAANQTNTISPPSDYDGCTREKMYKSKCRKRWVNQKSLTLHGLFTLQRHKTDDTTLFADNMWLSTLNPKHYTLDFAGEALHEQDDNFPLQLPDACERTLPNLRPVRRVWSTLIV